MSIKQMEPRRKKLEEEQQESDRMHSFIRQIISGIYLFIYFLLLLFFFLSFSFTIQSLFSLFSYS